MNPILLSICIPTYNRAEILISRIQEILQYKGKDIEIIVLDNCSSDNTEQQIKNLTDHRIRYYRNRKPLLPSTNWIETYKYANGRFAYHLNDRDHLYGIYLENFLNKLNNEISCGYCIYGEAEAYTEYFGIEARQQVPFSGYHVSGVLINVEKLKAFYQITDYQNRTILKQPNVEPRITLLYDLSTKGAWLDYRSPMSCNAGAEILNGVSGVINTEGRYSDFAGKLWFEPPYIYSLFMDVLDHILKDKLSKNDKRKVICSGVERVLKAVTATYGIYMLSDQHRFRYGVSRYYINFWKLEKILFEMAQKLHTDLAMKDCQLSVSNWFWLIFKTLLRINKFKIYEVKKIWVNNYKYCKEQIN